MQANEKLNLSTLADIKRVEIDAFEANPMQPGGAYIVQHSELYDAVRSLAGYPAAFGMVACDSSFNAASLKVGATIKAVTGLDVFPHGILAGRVKKGGVTKGWSIHTDWEGVTFADSACFTLWAPLSHFGEPHVMLFLLDLWPPAHCEFLLDAAGLWGRTMDFAGLYQHYGEPSALRCVELSLGRNELLLFNGVIPHMTHPDSPLDRSFINFRCPHNRGTAAQPRIWVNRSSPYAPPFEAFATKTPLNSDLVFEVDVTRTPKGYYEMVAHAGIAGWKNSGIT